MRLRSRKTGERSYSEKAYAKKKKRREEQKATGNSSTQEEVDKCSEQIDAEETGRTG
jgi:predicted CopG family antitoxin